jgi:hypothetical protein
MRAHLLAAQPAAVITDSLLALLLNHPEDGR